MKNDSYRFFTQFQDDLITNESNIFISKNEHMKLDTYLYLKSEYDVKNVKGLTFNKIAAIGCFKNLSVALGIDNLLSHETSDSSTLHLGGNLGVNLHTKNIEYAKFFIGTNFDWRHFIMVMGLKSWSTEDHINKLYPTFKLIINEEYNKEWSRNIELDIFKFETTLEQNENSNTMSFVN